MLEQALDLAQEAHIRLLIPWIAAALGAAYALAGQTADALPLLEQAVAQAVAMRFMRDQALLGDLAGRGVSAGRPPGRGVYPGAAGPGVLPGPPGTGSRSLRPAAPWRDCSAAQSRRRLSRPKRTTSRRSPWPRNWACVPLQAHCHRGLGTLYSQDGTAGAGTCRASHGHRAVPRHGDDLLAAPDRGGAGADRGKTSVSQVTIHSPRAARSPGLSCDSKSGASTWVHASPWRLRAPASGSRIQPLTDTQQRQRSARPSSRRARRV